MNVEDRLRDALSARAGQYEVDVEEALRSQQASHVAGNAHEQGAIAAVLRHRFVAIVTAAAAVAVIAAGIPIATHLIGDRDQRAVTPPATETPTAAPSPTSNRSPSASASQTASPSPSASTSVPPNGVGATLSAVSAASVILVQHELATGKDYTTMLTGVDVRSLAGASLGSYAIAGQPHAFDISPDGKLLAYMRSDGIHVANARDDSNDHIVHAVPSAPGQNCSQDAFACAGYGSFLRWSYDDAELAVDSGSLWVMSADGSSIREIARNATSAQEGDAIFKVWDGGEGILDARWSPTSRALAVTLVGDAAIVPAATTVSFPSQQQYYGQFVVSADGMQDQVLPSAPVDLAWTPDGLALASVDKDGVAHRVALNADLTGGSPAGLSFSRTEWAPDGVTSPTGQWSPDGARYVWVDPNVSGPGGTAVVYPADGGTGYKLAGHFEGWLDPHRVLVETEPSSSVARLVAVDVVADTQQPIGDVPIVTRDSWSSTDQFAIG